MSEATRDARPRPETPAEVPAEMTDHWTQRVLEEHRELARKTLELRRFLEEPRPEIGSKGAHSWAAELAGKLIALHDELFRHFRFEDEGGMVEDLSTSHPRASAKIEDLVNEHPVFLREVRRLMEEALTYSEGKTPDAPALRHSVISLLDRLRLHEQAENHLIQGLEYRDLGAPD